ncbi:MAG: ABC-2 family transporter protein [Oligoflexia bacterium]|nr:ABC-2 family transporter protein [Oligoflexia bacterium]
MKILRYLKLYGYFVRFSVSRSMEFRIDFFFRIIMDLLYYVVNLAFFHILYKHTPALAGWREPEMMVFVSVYLLIDAINMTLFSNNMWILPSLVNKGDLDYYLIRPVSSLFFLSLREFAFNSFINLIIALGIVAWAFMNYPHPISFFQIIFFFFNVCVGTLLYFSVRLITLLPVFWTHSARGFDALFWPMTRFMERPDRIFNGWTRVLFITVLPFSLMASYPARLFLDQFDPLIFLHLISAAIIYFLLLIWAWNRALKVYSSASS